MTLSSLLIQLLNGLASASSLFLVAAGLSLIFGVSRIVNFAHGSLYMLGLYGAYTFVDTLGGVLGFWPALLIAPIAVGLLGAALEMLVLRRVYQAPELLQLLATFALVLMIKDAALWAWGPQELLGPRAPGLAGAVTLLDRRFPQYDLLLIVLGPAILGLLWLLLHTTRWGLLVRAATQDREMLGALGVNQAWLFTSVFALGAALAGLGGALQLPRQAAALDIDMLTIGAAFVVVVVGGMGSIAGAYWAALLIAQAKALCIWLGVVEIAGMTVSFSKLTLVVEFLIMALVLVARPYGLFGKPQSVRSASGAADTPLHAGDWRFKTAVGLGMAVLACLPLLSAPYPYALVLGIDVMIAVLFASSLHFMMGPGGMHSFGHAAYFGLGAYCAAWGVKGLGWPMEAALLLAPVGAALGGLIFGWFCVRLSSVYLAMLTLAFAQITWAICFQWDAVTGGSNGLTGLWPAPWLADTAHYYWATLGLVLASLWMLRRLVFSPFGLAMRCVRDSPLRAQALGISVQRVQWTAFAWASFFAGLAGALFAFSKGSISPDVLGLERSVDALVMVLLGGIQALSGPVIGAIALTGLHDYAARATEYWRAFMGLIILVLVLLFPYGLAGWRRGWRLGLSRGANDALA